MRIRRDDEAWTPPPGLDDLHREWCEEIIRKARRREIMANDTTSRGGAMRMKRLLHTST